MGVIFLLPLSKVNSAKKIPATFGGSGIHVRERGRAFHAAIISFGPQNSGPSMPQELQVTCALLCPLTNTFVLPHAGQGKITSGMFPPPQPRPSWRLLSSTPQLVVLCMGLGCLHGTSSPMADV